MALPRDLMSFIKSVNSVKDSQDKYSTLPALKIDVPEFSEEFSANIKKLNPKVDVDFYIIFIL